MRCSRSRAARTGSHRCRRRRRRARSPRPRAPRTRSRSRCSGCCAGERRPAGRSFAASDTRCSPAAARRRRSCRRGRSRPPRPPRAATASSSTRPGSTAPSNGQPKAAPIVTVARMPSAWARSTIVAAAATDSAGRGVLVAAVERLGRGEREVHLVEPGRRAAGRSPSRSAPARRRPRRRAGRSRRRPPRRRPSAGRAPG